MASIRIRETNYNVNHICSVAYPRLLDCKSCYCDWFLYCLLLIASPDKWFSCEVCRQMSSILCIGRTTFFKILPSVWNDIIAFIALVISIVVIWLLAPYNHPNMNLSPEEVTACAKSAKGRLCILVFALSVLYVGGQNQFALGILLGIVMTASILTLAYCL